MKSFKRLAITLIATLICVFSAVIFTGCEDDDTCKLYVFASVGGCVKVEGYEDTIRFGDEGSRYFTYKEDSGVKLKAIADPGYQFQKWVYVDDLDSVVIDVNNNEIQFVIDEEKTVIKALFALDGSVSYTVTYPTAATGYNIIPESGYTTNVALGGDFKFKLNLWNDYSNSDVVVKANGVQITPNASKVYTIPNIKQDINITVTGIEENNNAPTTFTIYTTDNRFTIIPVSSENCQVGLNESFVFSIQPASGWQLAADAVVKANGVALTLVDGNYCIYYVDSDINITIDGIQEYIEPEIYNITFRGEGFDIIPQAGSSFQTQEGNFFSFTIRLKEGYEFDSTVIVKANSTILTDTAGVYFIYGVYENIQITVQGVVEIEEFITYTLEVVFADEDLVSLVPDLLFYVPQSVTFTVSENDSYLFGEYASNMELSFEVNGNNQTITLQEMIDNIDNFFKLEENLIFAREGVNYLSVGNEKFIYETSGVLTVDLTQLYEGVNTLVIYLK